jgi:hypothetical protein
LTAQQVSVFVGLSRLLLNEHATVSLRPEWLVALKTARWPVGMRHAVLERVASEMSSQ